MRKRAKTSAGETMLELWRPPQGAGEPIGCLATTYTFHPGLFEEQCLARFLEIDSDPRREDLPFLLERESRLGGVYSGVMVDYTQAGVEHSLRWDVIPVRIRGGKQHAKLSLLAWSGHVRIIVASANLSEPGYRSNHEVAATIDLSAAAANPEILDAAIDFFRTLCLLVPGASEQPTEVRRAKMFLNEVEKLAQPWKAKLQKGTIRQHLVCTYPEYPGEKKGRSSMEEAIQACRKRGESPNSAWIASPFFDINDETSRVTAALCKLMARGGHRKLCFCVPTANNGEAVTHPRLAAPKTLLLTPKKYGGHATVKMLPNLDDEKNHRPWHAKMLALIADRYSALMIGSSNFTCAGMGVGRNRNTEANLLTIVDRVAYRREVGQLEAVWPEMETVVDPDSAEWLGAQPDREEEEQGKAPPLPFGFLHAIYRAGGKRQIVLRLSPEDLPTDWHVHACGQQKREILSASAWHKKGRPSTIELNWAPTSPPTKLLVQWTNESGKSPQEAFLPINAEDISMLPPPEQLKQMSADDLLWLLAASDTGAAYRSLLHRDTVDQFDPDLDSATPSELDPLRRYDLQATFLHRVRRRARILAQMRANLQRPVWGRQVLEWRLQGLIGIEALADRLAHEFVNAGSRADEALLTLADFLIVLGEVDYQPSEGSLTKDEFDTVFQPFMKKLAGKLRQQLKGHGDHLAEDLRCFWGEVLEQCRK